MKMMIVLASLVLSTSALASSKVPDCYREKNVVRGQFLVLLAEGLHQSAQKSVMLSLARLELSIVDKISDDTWLVERTALSAQSRAEEIQTLKGLDALIGNQVEAIGCNGLMQAIQK